LPQAGTWEPSDSVVTIKRSLALPLRNANEEERALRASEQMYRELVENASDLIYVIDLQGNFTSINRAAQRISGYTRAEALKMNIAQLVASEYLESARQMIQKALRGEPATTSDLEIVTKDGRRVMLEISHRLVLQNGIPRGTHAIARDITERKVLEDQLRRSERKFSTLVENSPDIISRLDRDLRYIYISPALERIWDVATDRFIGRTPSEIALTGYDWKSFEESCQEAFSTGQIVVREFVHEERHFRSRVIPELNPDGVSVKGCSYIYAPAGQAGEYAPLAANPYRGCVVPWPRFGPHGGLFV